MLVSALVAMIAAVRLNWLVATIAGAIAGEVAWLLSIPADARLIQGWGFLPFAAGPAMLGMLIAMTFKRCKG